MSPTRVHPRLLPLLAAALSIAPTALAQTPIAGPIFNGSGGPLLAGTVYHATGNLAVPAGQTLTIQPGAILKFNGNGLGVDGTLDAQGTVGSPIVFTAIQDDGAGGDTNGNGPSAGAPDQWAGLSFGPAADASVLDRIQVRYSGVAFSPAVRLNGTDLTLRNSTLRDGQHGLLDLGGNSKPIVEGCTFSNSGSRAVVFNAWFDGLPGFSNNAASGTGVGNYIEVGVAAPASDVTVSLDDCINEWLVVPSGIQVPAGRTLTFGAGIFVKAGNGTSVQVAGTLKTFGSQEDPVVFTTLPDDQYGGDTNNNGPSSGAPDTWGGLGFAATAGASQLSNTIVRYSGTGFSAAVEISGSSPSFSDCLFRDGQHGAIDLNGIPAAPTFTRCAFQDNAAYAAQIAIGNVPGFVDCAALGSTYGQFLRIVSGTVTAPITIGPENTVGGALVLATPLVVPAGQTLTLKRGTVFKSESGSGASIAGTLNVLADGSSPAVFTHIGDDAFGGDTNQNGPSSGSPDSWAGVGFAPGSSGSVTGFRVRYAGSGFTAGIDVQSAGVTLRAARADFCVHDGFRVTAHGGDARDWVAFACGDQAIELGGGSFALRNATVVGSTGSGIAKVGSFAGTVRNSIAFGNGGGDYAGFAAADVSWSLAAAFAGQNGNFGGAPSFVNQAAGDLRLAFGSPCIEAGNPAEVATGGDAGGAPRLTDGNFDGVRRLDAGAHEFTQVGLAITGTPKLGGTLTFTTTGSAGLPVLLALGFAGQTELPPHGTLFLNVAFPWLLAPFGAVPSAVPLPIPLSLPVLPIEVAFQEIVTSGTKANLSNVAHVRITN